MNNTKIEQLGIDFVLEYEKRNGWLPEIIKKHGYDILSKNGKKVKLIEVKATSKERFSWRTLEELEYKALKNNFNYFLYTVTNVGNETEKPCLLFSQEKRF